MRIAKVVGKLSLVKAHPSLVGKRWVLAVPLDLRSLVDSREPPSAEELVVVDELGASDGARIGLAESMEATFPYYPAKVPVDAYNACLLDSVELDRAAAQTLFKENA